MTKYIPMPIMPTDEELKYSSNFWWKTQEGISFLDWNDTLKTNSFPLRLVKMPATFIDDYLTLIDGKSKFNSVLDQLTELITPSLNELGCNNSFFIKLVSRSPKDAMVDDFEVKTIEQAVHLLASSMRCFDDMCHFKYIPEKAYLVIRPFVNIEKWAEWRVFIKEGEINGITQYYYQEDFGFSESGGISMIKKEVESFVKSIVIPNINVKSFVADVVISNGDYRTMLLETNPYGLSDPCLFESYDNLDGTIKYVISKNK